MQPSLATAAPVVPVGAVVFAVLALYAFAVVAAIWLHVRATRRAPSPAAYAHPAPLVGRGDRREAMVGGVTHPRPGHADASRYPELASHRRAGRSPAR